MSMHFLLDDKCVLSVKLQDNEQKTSFKKLVLLAGRFTTIKFLNSYLIYE